MMVFSVVIAATVIALLEVPSLIEQKLSKELWIFTGLLLFASSIGIMQGLKLEIPNPFDWLTYIFSPMTKLIQKFLK
jgi:hypothetical protein